MRLLRLLRGIVGTAITWAIAWVPLTLILFGGVALAGGDVPPTNYLGRVLMQFAVGGAVSGAVFAAVLAIAGRRRTLDTLTFRSMFAWGALGGVFFPALIMGVILMNIPAATFEAGKLAVQICVTGAMGALCAGGTLYAARRAPIRLESPAYGMNARIESR